MDKSKLISRCGLWCGACKTYLLTKKNLLGERGLKRECHGCWIRDKNCSFIKKDCSLLRKNKIDFCYECESFPCENLSKLDGKYKSKYHVSLIENLKKMKEVGLEEWIKEQEKLYECPECGGEICVHESKCFDCGKKS
jgi:hypothetical protein